MTATGGKITLLLLTLKKALASLVAEPFNFSGAIIQQGKFTMSAGAVEIQESATLSSRYHVANMHILRL